MDAHQTTLPAELSSELLPTCNILLSTDDREENNPLFQKVYAIEDYEQLFEYMQELIGADCWALVENAKIVLNAYCDHDADAIDHPHQMRWFEDVGFEHMRSIFLNNGTVQVYMYGNYPWKIVFSSVQGIVTQDYYASLAYVQRFVNA